jgi:hypothetical protein
MLAIVGIAAFYLREITKEDSNNWLWQVKKNI